VVDALKELNILDEIIDEIGALLRSLKPEFLSQ